MYMLHICNLAQIGNLHSSQPVLQYKTQTKRLVILGTAMPAPGNGLIPDDMG